jgi:hypothetical protein
MMAAPYIFQDVFIQIFDVNAIPDLLRSPLPAARKLPFGFLANKSDYEKKQSSDETLNTSSFVLQRFPKNKLKDSELWDRYADVYPSPDVPYWDRQIPFYVRLRKQALSLAPELHLEPGKVSVDSFVTLNALGWSTHLEIRLRSDLTPAALAGIVAALRSKNAAAYLLNTTPMNLKDIFKFYKDNLLLDGFRPDLISNQPDNYWHIANVDVIKAEGQETKFTRLKNIDLNGFLNVSFPNHAPVQYEIAGEDRTPKVQNMLFTDVDGEYHNFSMTDFNGGCFTFLQTEALAGAKESRLMCYARNTCECLWLCYAWFNFRRLVDNVAPNSKIGRLLKSGDDALVNLGRTFNNRTCQGMFRNHKDMPKEA